MLYANCVVECRYNSRRVVTALVGYQRLNVPGNNHVMQDCVHCVGILFGFVRGERNEMGTQILCDMYVGKTIRISRHRNAIDADGAVRVAVRDDLDSRLSRLDNL